MNSGLVEINTMGIFLMLLILFHNHATKRNRKSALLLNQIAFLMCLAMSGDIAYFFSDGASFSGAGTINSIGTAVYFIGTNLSTFCWMYYVYIALNEKVSLRPVYTTIASTPLFIFLVMTLSSPWTHWIYYIDQANHYVRGDFYFVQVLVGCIYIITGSVVALIKLKGELLPERRRTFINLCVYTMLPLLGGVAQAAFYGLNTTTPATIVAVVMLYLDNIKQSVSLDYLSDLNNRRQFDNYLYRRISTLAGDDELFLIFLDIDNFRNINDVYGHVEGDNAIVLVADALINTFDARRSMLARYGGDEFSVIAIGHEDNVRTKLDEVAASLENASEKLPYGLSLSSGYARYGEPRADTIDGLIKLADFRMRRSQQDRKLSSSWLR